MRKDRLLKLADYLENHVAKLPRDRFDMLTFYSVADGKRLGECGTAACAFGWAVTIPEFRADGLTLRDKRIPIFGDSMDPYEAAAMFFQIDQQAADCLFLPIDGHRTPRQVARNIRRFVETGELP